MQFRFRFEGRQRSPAIPLAGGHGAVLQFRRDPQEAIAGSRDLDAGNRPIRPAAATANAAPVPAAGPPEQPEEEEATGGADVVDLFDPQRAHQPRPPAETIGRGSSSPVTDAGRALIGVGQARMTALAEPPAPLVTFEDLVGRQTAELAATRAKNKPSKRTPNTLSNVDGELRFAADFFCTGAGDMKRSRPVDGEGRIDEDDCLDFLLYRKHTNLKTRVANERELERWAHAVDKADAHGLMLPPRPALAVEVAKVHVDPESTDQR